MSATVSASASSWRQPVYAISSASRHVVGVFLAAFQNCAGLGPADANGGRDVAHVGEQVCIIRSSAKSGHRLSRGRLTLPCRFALALNGFSTRERFSTASSSIFWKTQSVSDAVGFVACLRFTSSSHPKFRP